MAQHGSRHDGIGWLADYIAKLWTELIGPRQLHYPELKGVVPATTATEEQRSVASSADLMAKQAAQSHARQDDDAGERAWARQ